MGQLVAREAEQIAADERAPEGACEVAAEEVGAAGGATGISTIATLNAATGPASSVIGETSAAIAGTELVHMRFAPPGAQIAWLTNGFSPVQDGMRPPGESPDEELRVGAVAGIARAARLEQRQPEEAGTRGAP